MTFAWVWELGTVPPKFGPPVCLSFTGVNVPVALVLLVTARASDRTPPRFRLASLDAAGVPTPNLQTLAPLLFFERTRTR